MPHLVATLNYLSQIYSYYIKGDRSPLISELRNKNQIFCPVTSHINVIHLHRIRPTDDICKD